MLIVPKSDSAKGYLINGKSIDAYVGKVDDGEVLAVDTSKLPLVLGTASVTIKY